MVSNADAIPASMTSGSCLSHSPPLSSQRWDEPSQIAAPRAQLEEDAHAVVLETVVRLKDVTELDDDDAAALASFEAVIKNGAAGDSVTDVVHKIKFWNKLDALNALAQHLGILKNQMEVTGLEDLFARLDAGRARNAAHKKETEKAAGSRRL